MNTEYSSRYEDLRKRVSDFALRIIRLFRSLPRNEEARVIGRQFLRSGTSIGANYRASCRSRSSADFIAKMNIVLEEADETAYWLELVVKSGIVIVQKLSALMKECDELVRIFAASIITAEKNAARSRTPRTRSEQ